MQPARRARESCSCSRGMAEGGGWAYGGSWPSGLEPAGCCTGSNTEHPTPTSLCAGIEPKGGMTPFFNWQSVGNTLMMLSVAATGEAGSSGVGCV